VEVTQEEEIPVGGGPQVNRLERTALDTPRTGGGLQASLETQLENQGVTKNDVKSVELKRVRLEVTEPLRNGAPLQDLRFLDSLSMYVAAPGMPEVLVAQSVPPPRPDGGPVLDGGSPVGATFGVGVTSVDVPLAPGVELKGYVTAPSMTVRTDIQANGKPALSCTVRFTTTLSVQVTAAGVLSRLPLPTP
jgi:hypothetical protein